MCEINKFAICKWHWLLTLYFMTGDIFCIEKYFINILQYE